MAAWIPLTVVPRSLARRTNPPFRLIWDPRQVCRPSNPCQRVRSTRSKSVCQIDTCQAFGLPLVVVLSGMPILTIRVNAAKQYCVLTAAPTDALVVHSLWGSDL